MFTKKLALSLFTVPCAVWTYGISDYHQRRKNQKQTERARRQQLLSGEVIDITPKNGSKLPWSNVTDEQFQSEWSMKPVKIRGRFDFSVQLKVKKMVHNEIMYEIITPFYTHLDDSGNQVAILVNRGVEAKDFVKHNYSLTDQKGYQTISGVFYKGDPQNKYVMNNQPTINNWLNVKPRDLALYQKVPNINEGVDRFMIKQIDIGQTRRMPHPNPPSAEELLHWPIEPQRHQAYSRLFSFFTYLNMVCNTALWLYF